MADKLEDTTGIDRELIAQELERTARLAERLGLADTVRDISATVSKLRQPQEAGQE